MFRFRRIKQHFLHLYAETNDESHDSQQVADRGADNGKVSKNNA